MRVDLGNGDVSAIANELQAASPVVALPTEDVKKTVRSTGRADSAATGYCLWEFDGAAWIMKKDRCYSGYVPSAPPSVPGRFPGQLRAVMSVRAAAIVGEQAMIVPGTER